MNYAPFSVGVDNISSGRDQIRRNSFESANQIIKAVNEFVETYQENPRPFIWKANADEIIRKVAKLRNLQAERT